MGELAFAKSFLASLESKPIKLPTDFVSDPSQTDLRVPYLLPRLRSPHPDLPKKTRSTTAPGSSKSITLHLKSARNPSLEFSVPNAPLSTTSVEDLKDAVRARVADSAGNQIPLEKIKILYKKKPVTGKTMAEVVADEPGLLGGGKAVELGVMIMGGAVVVEQSGGNECGDGPAGSGEKKEGGDAAKGNAGVLETEAFWDELKVFLEERVKDGQEAERLKGLFKGAWSASR